MFLSIDDQSWFCDMLIQRDELVQSGYYKSWFLFFWDAGQAIDLLRRYVTDGFSQLINVTIRIPKK